MFTLSNPCQLPILAELGTSKIYCRLDHYGALQSWQYTGESWYLLEDNLFNQYLCGFDGAMDNQGLLHLLGYDGYGNIYHTHLQGPGHWEEPELFYSAPRHNIYQLSCCFDPLQQLHVLYLVADEESKAQQLFYLHRTYKRQAEPVFVDTAPVAHGSHCCILSDRQNHIYMLYPMLDEGRLRLAFRKMDITRNRPGRVYLFPGRQEGACWPSYYCDAQNYIHISWISGFTGNTCLNYIRRDKQGDWRYFMQLEVPPQTLPAAPLSSNGNDLLLIYQWEKKLGFLYSRNGGINWKKGKEELLNRECVLTRLRIASGAGGKETGSKQELFFCSNLPPPRIEEKASAHDTAVDSNINSLALLSSYIFERARDLEEDNRVLAQNLAEKEKELDALQVREQARLTDLEQMLKEKTLHANELELLFKERLQLYVNKMEEEKSILREQINLLRMDVIKLQDRKKNLLHENNRLLHRISYYEEKEKNLLFSREKAKINMLDWLRRKIKPLRRQESEFRSQESE